MTFNGWAVGLGGIMLTTCAEQAEWDALGCFPVDVLPVMAGPPDGLDLPDLRTEDVTYYQRDGVKHFSDWYTPRFITVTGTLGPNTCVDGDCSTVRQQLQDLVQAWKRGCCDTELVIFPDCYVKDLTTGENVYPDGSFDTDDDGWTMAFGGGSVARVTSPVHDGAGALRITWGTDAAGAAGALGPTFAGEPNTSYVVSAWLYAAIGQPAPVLNATQADILLPQSSDPISTDGSYHKVQVTVPSGDTGEILIYVSSDDPTTAGDIAYVDTVEAVQINPALNRTLNGPFGVVGRPRVFQYNWRNRTDQIVDFTARFDAVDQRMYVLDECGTPGYTQCEVITPGTEKFSICFSEQPGYTDPVVCFSGETEELCFVQEVDDSVAPVGVSIGGTEKVNPTLTFYPPLAPPILENVTTGEWIGIDGTLTDTPVTVNTEDGTAFDGNGNSLTHLLRGSLFIGMVPGNYQWRLISNSLTDEPGYATLCWRDTVVAA